MAGEADSNGFQEEREQRIKVDMLPGGFKTLPGNEMPAIRRFQNHRG
jgi:hypothetical protein